MCSGDAHQELRQSWWTWEHQPTVAIVGCDGREAVAIARAFDVTLSMPGIEIDCIGIGGVYVEESHRGRGCAKQVVNALVMTMGGSRRPFALWARDGRLYEALNFERINDRDGHGIYALSRGAVTIRRHDLWELNRRF